ncbi:MAG: PIN domain-containing protein [Deltaproteobacteria bacterium]|nr:PIN domain-containing protein [Deltaproteobacteria bacterium]
MTELRLLDTCVVSQYLAPDAPTKYPALVQWVRDLVTGQGVCLSVVTVYELRRGVRLLVARGEGRRKERRLNMFLQEATALSLDHDSGKGWNVAADLWVKGQMHRPALNVAEADLLILATAIVHGRVLLTTDAALGERARELGVGEAVEVAPLG